MNKRGIFIATILSFVCVSLYAQVPLSFNYQAVARYDYGGLISNELIGVRIGILYGTPSDSTVYLETHSTSTNQYGLFSLNIGSGIPLSGTFSSIDWAKGPYYIQIELDETGGTAFHVLDTAQLTAVPYALDSASTGDTSRWQKTNDDLYFNSGNIGVGTNTPGVKLDVIGDIRASGGIQLGTTAGIAINDTCTNEQAGMIIYNGTNFCACNGTIWKKVD